MQRPVDVAAAAKAAESAYEAQNWRKVWDLYSSLCGSNPDPPAIYLGRLAEAAYALNQNEGAVGLWSEYLRREPTDEVAYCNRGFAHIRLQDYKAAWADFEKSIALCPTYSPAYNGRSRVWEHLSTPAQAMVELSKAVELCTDPASAQRWKRRLRNLRLGFLPSAAGVKRPSDPSDGAAAKRLKRSAELKEASAHGMHRLHLLPIHRDR